MACSTELSSFMENWQEDPIKAKVAFIDYLELLDSNPDIHTEFKARPNISYSLRAKHKAQKNRDLFVLIDVVDDDPKNRWLSVCFYADLVTDPDEKGDIVPDGLNGEDALCLNLDEDDDQMRSYIKIRLQEAIQKSGK